MGTQCKQSPLINLPENTWVIFLSYIINKYGRTGHTEILKIFKKELTSLHEIKIHVSHVKNRILGIKQGGGSP